MKTTQENEESINQRLERIRKARGLTAKAVARQIEVPESTYREWEYGRGLKLPPFQKLSQVLAISVTELVTGQKPVWQSQLDELEKIEQKLTQLRLLMSSLI